MATVNDHAYLVCLTGPECSGKTSTARALATALDLPLIGEVAREYLKPGVAYERTDLVEIARLQQQAETTVLKNAPAHGLVAIADTDTQVIRIWWQQKYGDLSDELKAATQTLTPRRYLLARPDLPWQPDPLRESEYDRDRLFNLYLSDLEEGGWPFGVLEGQDRVALALAHIRAWRRV
ncbi:MAG: ATP-binding protein [Proteobacteria bacterium]|nr:ATP-binding protein [Pseudomonadota bacterium]